VGRKRRHGNTAPQKTNNIIEILVKREGDKSPVAELIIMIIRMFNELKEELKEDIKKQLNKSQENTDKKLQMTQKQLTKLKEDFNKL
jgi:PHP family Zn ribbon phosphoesterase